MDGVGELNQVGVRVKEALRSLRRNRLRYDGWCESAILFLALALLVFSPIATGAVRPSDFLVVQGLVTILLGAWVVRFWVNRKHRVQWVPVCWAVLAFAVYAILRYRHADIEYVARQELIRILVYAFVFLAILNNLHRQWTTRTLVNVLLGLGTLLAMYAIYQFITGSTHVLGYDKPIQYKGRGSGTFICPNHLAGLLEMLLPLALANLFMGKSSYAQRVVYGYVSLVLAAGIAVTVSRGAWISTGLALLVFFGVLLRMPGYRKPALGALLALVAGIYVFVRVSQQPQRRFTRMYTPGQLEDTGVRASLWGAAMQMWRDRFWLGVGPAHFDYRFRGYRPEVVQSRPYWAHNDYLNALADWGAVGGAILLAALACLTAGALKTWRFVKRAHNDLVTRPSDRAAHVLGVGVGLLALLFHSVVDFNLQIPANALVAVALMASLASHLRFATDDYWVTPRLPGRILATLVCGLGIAYLAPQAWHRAFEQHYLRQAEQASAYPDQIAALKRALAAEPANGDTAYMIGEAYRLQSWEGAEGYQAQALEAMEWFDLAARLNPLETYNWLRLGMCLDWLRRHAQAEVFFDRARSMDPNNYYMVAMAGWHALQKGDTAFVHNQFGQAEQAYASARGWLERSLRLKWYDNSIATSLLQLLERRAAQMPTAP